ncbi:MAG: GerMN domain-containing protein [Geobacteraceae bacterium]|nr:GerMN domain-containing protein [Geobacteraceae bacterium]
MKRNSSPRRRAALLLVAFLVSAAVLGALILRKYEMRRLKPAPPPQTEVTGTLLVTLFFASPDAQGLVREAREIGACAEPAECAAEVVAELINGPVGELFPTLPPAATVRSVRLEGETALVDLGREFAAGLPGGSHGEMMALYSLVDSLAFNFPRIKKVQFLLEGEKVASIGHLDLSAPLLPDFSLEKKQ